MAIAEERIRVSARVKRQLDRRRREGESYNDVLERVLAESAGAERCDGSDRWSDERVEQRDRQRERAREKRKRRKKRLHHEDVRRFQR